MSTQYSAKLEDRDTHIRESWVRAMEARLVRDELEKCQKSEGVNHYENCKWLSELYLNKLKDAKVSVLFAFSEFDAEENVSFHRLEVTSRSMYRAVYRHKPWNTPHQTPRTLYKT